MANLSYSVVLSKSHMYDIAFFILAVDNHWSYLPILYILPHIKTIFQPSLSENNEGFMYDILRNFCFKD